MESMLLLSLVVAALVVAPATPNVVTCINGNCTESDAPPGLTFNLGSIFPFFGPVDFNSERDREPMGEVIDPMEPSMATNESEPSGGIFSIHIMKVFTIRDPSQDLAPPRNGLGEPVDDFGPSPLLQKMFDNIFADIGYLDLSGRNLTSEDVRAALNARKAEGRPVRTLNLRNSRVHPMDAGTFAPAESDLENLDLSNTSVNLEALTGLTNLKTLNVSHNGLTTFLWFGLMADSLEVLDLSHNNYEEIRPELSMLKSLRHLYLSNNKIMFVEEAPLSLLPNLETLDLSMNVLLKANLASLTNLNQLNLDWNYLRLMGADCRLPPQPISVTLASNPWRCDCGLLQSRDNNEILDLDLLQCAMHSSFDVGNYCVGCERPFLPDQDGQPVAALTKDLIGHRGCKDIPELYNYISDEYVKLRDNEPGKLVQDILLFITISIFLLVCVFVIFKICFSPRALSEGKVWVRAQDIPKWSFDKLGKQQEVPYVKVEKTPIKA